MRRTFVIGDIHGAYRALRQCLERSHFDLSNDHLICLGDVADGWPETAAAIEELLAIRHITYILGNHDWWALDWMQHGRIEQLWYDQGGKATIDSYPDGVPESHIRFLSQAHLYYVHDNKLFVHAGVNPLRPLEEQSKEIFLWDRTLSSLALELRQAGAEGRLSQFDEIYIGHTPVTDPQPVNAMEIWLMDTGAGWSGRLSMMDIDTKELFISDPVPSLYPGIQGRQKKKP